MLPSPPGALFAGQMSFSCIPTKAIQIFSLPWNDDPVAENSHERDLAAEARRYRVIIRRGYYITVATGDIEI